MMLAARIPGWPRALQPLAESCCSAGRAAFVTTHLGTGMPSPASLNDIMKVDEMRGKTAGEVEEIWMQVGTSGWDNDHADYPSVQCVPYSSQCMNYRIVQLHDRHA